MSSPYFQVQTNVEQWFFKCGPWTSINGITCEQVRNAKMRASPTSSLRNSGVAAQEPVFSWSSLWEFKNWFQRGLPEMWLLDHWHTPLHVFKVNIKPYREGLIRNHDKRRPGAAVFSRFSTFARTFPSTHSNSLPLALQAPTQMSLLRLFPAFPGKSNCFVLCTFECFAPFPVLACYLL